MTKKSLRERLLNLGVGLVVCALLVSPVYGAWEAHENHILQQQAIAQTHKDHEATVKSNKKLAAADGELGKFAQYIVETNQVNCANIATVTQTFHLHVVGCPSIPSFAPIGK